MDRNERILKDFRSKNCESCAWWRRENCVHPEQIQVKNGKCIQRTVSKW